MCRVLLVLAMLAGCDRVFGLHQVQDAPPFVDPDAHRDGMALDTPPGCGVNNPHNEDLDSFPDECDNCPDLPNTGTDSDHDGIGDECDPGPSQADMLVHFWTCQTLDGLLATPQVVQLADALRLPQGEAVTASIPANTTLVRFTVQLAANAGDAVRLDIGAVGLTFTAKACAGNTEPACLHGTDGSDTPVASPDLTFIGATGNKWFAEAGGMVYVHAQPTPVATVATLTAVTHVTSIKSVIAYAR